MRNFSSCLFAFVLLSSTASAQSLTDRARAVVDYLNAELGKSRYKSITLHNENCTDSCFYSLTSTSFVEIGIDRVRIVANIESSPDASDFSEDMKAATYLFSLIVWGNMPSSASYEDANRFLGDLLETSSGRGAAVASTNNWTYGVVHIKCFGPSTMLIALKTLSSSVNEVGELPAHCKK
ncbi:MAG: hypothetical protein NW216_02205 [Hyphomicrobium sp.]|nr:hypothetical protein [Hyphomicrobium sp.]